MATETITVNVGKYDDDHYLYTDPTGDVSGKNADNTSSEVEMIGHKGATNWIYFPFDVSAIPANAQIDSVYCRFRAWIYFLTYTSNATGSLCSGTVEKVGTSFQDTTSKVYTLSGGSWTRDELARCRLKLSVTFSSSSNATNVRRRFFFAGADLTVTYTYQSEKFMLKLGGAWHDAARVFKKVNGIWVEQEELANVIEDGVRYQNGGEYVAPVKKISFTIGGTSYQAEEGMTWSEWVASSYNTGGFINGTTSAGGVYLPSEDEYVYTSNWSFVNKNDVIIAGHGYGLSM